MEVTDNLNEDLVVGEKIYHKKSGNAYKVLYIGKTAVSFVYKDKKTGEKDTETYPRCCISRTFERRRKLSGFVQMWQTIYTAKCNVPMCMSDYTIKRDLVNVRNEDVPNFKPELWFSC